MKKYLICFLAPLLMFGFLSCAQTGGKLSVDEFEKQAANSKNSLLLDVRTPEEYKEGHLHNAENINYNAGDFATRVNTLDKNKTVFIYCLSGGRSAAAADYLRKNGFHDVKEMQGGIMKWKASGKPLEGNTAEKLNGMNTNDLNKLTSSDHLVLVDFKAKWCGPCRMLAPVLDEFSKEHKDKIKVISIDIDENPVLTKEQSISEIPLLMLYKDKKLIFTHTGYIDKPGLEELLNK